LEVDKRLGGLFENYFDGSFHKEDLSIDSNVTIRILAKKFNVPKFTIHNFTQ